MSKKIIFAILIGLLLGLLIPFIAGYLFLISGGMPVATKGPPLPLERTIARMATRAAMRNQTELTSPVSADEVNLLAGVKVYQTNCAICHGLPDDTPTAVASGLFPKPPHLFPPDIGVIDDPVGKIFWKVKNGIRLTGMPGFVDSLSETEMWQVSLLLLNADKLPGRVKQKLQAGSTPTEVE